MGEIIGKLGYFDEMTILPNFTSRGAEYKNADLSLKLTDDIELTYPFMVAAMTSVVGKEMVEAASKNGMLPTIPTGLRTDYACEIISDLKRNELREGDLEFLRNPVLLRAYDDKNPGRGMKVKDAIELYENAGHSVIPICDDEKRFMGLFKYQDGIMSELYDVDIIDAIERSRMGDQRFSEIIKPFGFDTSKYGMDYAKYKDGKNRIHGMIKERNGIDKKGYIPVVAADGTLKGLAFIYKHKGTYVASAVHTYRSEKMAAALAEAGTDMFVIDTSDAANEHVLDTLRYLKKAHPDIPVCAGNIVEGGKMPVKRGDRIEYIESLYDELVNAGADVIKGGMGGGRICTTTDNRGVGRHTLRVGYDLLEAWKKSDNKRPIILDGGIGTVDPDNDKTQKIKTRLRQDTRSINLCLGVAPGVMMGTYFNMFDEACGPDHVINGIKYKENWGEGSQKAKSFARYGVGEGVRRANVEEGIEQLVPSVGRLKPGVEKTAMQIAMTMSNVGVTNLEDYREMIRIEGV